MSNDINDKLADAKLIVAFAQTVEKLSDVISKILNSEQEVSADGVTFFIPSDFLQEISKSADEAFEILKKAKQQREVVHEPSKQSKNMLN